MVYDHKGEALAGRKIYLAAIYDNLFARIIAAPVRGYDDLHKRSHTLAQVTR